MMGHGGGHGFVINRIGEGVVGMLGQGGGHCPIVFLARVYLPLCWCWFQSWFGCLLGQGGGQDGKVV